MSQISLLQIILLSLYAFIAINDVIHMDFGLNRPVMAGCFAGLIMNDLAFGLAVGATLHLMVMGISTFGGASMPDFMSAALIGKALGSISGEGIEFGIALAIPVGMLLIQLDVFTRFAHTYFQHQAEKAIEDCNIKKIEFMNNIGVVTWGLSRAIPVCLCLCLGSVLVESFVQVFPVWLSTGLKVAGGLLPSVGVAILLKYMPTKKYIAYLLIGFILAAYLKVPMLGISLTGLALALIAFKHSGENIAVVNSGGDDEDE